MEIGKEGNGFFFHACTCMSIYIHVYAYTYRTYSNKMQAN